MARERVPCPVCGSSSELGDSVGDNTAYICPKCGTYKLAGTLAVQWQNGVVKNPNPEVFRVIVKRKRDVASGEFPIISQFDL